MIELMQNQIGIYYMVINAIAHCVIFVGSLYVAVHNHKLPIWHITPLWYLGLCSLMVVISTMVSMFIDPNHILGYDSLGVVAELFSDIILAFISFLMMLVTVYNKYV